MSSIKTVYGDCKCPNGYKGENMVCCRCVKPMYPESIKPPIGDWEKRLIAKLGSLEIDHTDMDDEGNNRLCSNEIVEILDMVKPLLSQREKEVRKKMIEKIEQEGITLTLDKQYFPSIEVKRWNKLKVKLSKGTKE